MIAIGRVEDDILTVVSMFRGDGIRIMAHVASRKEQRTYVKALGG